MKHTGYRSAWRIWAGHLVQLFQDQTLEVRQPINAVFYRNTGLSSRIRSFIDYVVECLGDRGFEA